MTTYCVSLLYVLLHMAVVVQRNTHTYSIVCIDPFLELSHVVCTILHIVHSLRAECRVLHHVDCISQSESDSDSRSTVYAVTRLML